MLQYVDQMSRTHSHNDCDFAMQQYRGGQSQTLVAMERLLFETMAQCPETEHDQNSKTKI